VYLGNTPSQETTLRAEARKSFSIALWFTDSHGRALDISGSTIRLVVKELPLNPLDSTDADNLITNSEATVGPSADVGYAYLHLQASDLNHDPGEYPYAIVLRDAQGYSSVIVRGVLELLQNTEFASINADYVGVNPPTALQIAMRGLATISVRTGPNLAPGTTSFTDADKAKLDGIESGAQVNVRADWSAMSGSSFILNKPTFGSAAFAELSEIALPTGGLAGEVLMKIGPQDVDVAWQTPPTGPGGGNLDATGTAAGLVPTTSGVDTWSWDALPAAPVQSVNSLTGTVVLTLDDIADTATRVSMTPAERAQLGSLSLDWASITGKPAFGSASLLDSSAFLAPGGVAGADISSGTISAARLPKLSDLDGFSEGTLAPSGGADGDVYFQHS